MDGTHRFWTLVAVGVFVAGFGVLIDRPLVFVGTAALGAWLIAHQYRFLRAVIETRADLQVSQTVAPAKVYTDGTTEVTVGATRSGTAELDLTIEPKPPAAATGATKPARYLQLAPGETDGEITFTLTWPLPGAFTLDSPSLVVTDSRGLFREELRVGEAETVVVESRAPGNGDLYVGEGGTQTTPGEQFGDQLTGGSGGGIEPLEVRQYMPGDEVSRIDWNASARFPETYVREFASERGQQTVLVVDHGGAMADGVAGETKLDYARAVATGLLDVASDLKNPVGLYAVGDDGLSTRVAPRVGDQHSRTIRTELYELQPTQDDAVTRSEPESKRDVPAASPSDARQAAQRLRSDDTSFGTCLKPFFERSQMYVQRIAGNPLVETVRTYLQRLKSSPLTVIVTDDSDRVRTQEAVKLASRYSDTVYVFLTPTPLFAPDAVGDLDAAYDRYVEFEAFRRDLDAIENVSAQEVGPRDHLETILSQAQQRSR